MQVETLFVIAGTMFFVIFFLGVVFYAFDRRRIQEFQHQAQLPLEEEAVHSGRSMEGGVS